MHQRGEASILGQKLGPYYVSDKLGRGGMGAVYLAKDIALDRQAALKVLLPAYADDPEFVARFQREARASAKLNHPNIVQIYGVDIESDPAYMAMEYVDGETLDARLRRDGRMKWQTALSVVSQVAAALSCAHGAGIIHRDIKPANVLIDRSNRVKVADFGIAKVLGSNTRLTSTQHTVGSPCYMSPEQCGMGEVTPASDLFSLGILLYELLSDDLPFKGESGLAVMRQITTEDLPAIDQVVPGLPPVIGEFLRGLTARDPALRYRSAQDVLEDLRSFHGGAPMTHLQALAIRRGGAAPATASAADITRSPTGPSPALKTSLVADLLDDMPPPAPRPVRRFDVDVPWAAITTVAILALIIVAVASFWRGAPRNSGAGGPPGPQPPLSGPSSGEAVMPSQPPPRGTMQPSPRGPAQGPAEGQRPRRPRPENPVPSAPRPSN